MTVGLVRRSKGQEPRAPGLSLDGRQVVVGEAGLLRAPTWPALVRVVAALSAELPFGKGNLVVRLFALRGQTEEFLVRVRPEGSLRAAGQVSHAFDRIAALAARALGEEAPLLVGGGDVYVRYRDRASPTGYDLSAPLEADPQRVLAIFPFAGERVDVKKGEVRKLALYDDFVALLKPVAAAGPGPGPRYLLCDGALAMPMERALRRRSIDAAVSPVSTGAAAEEGEEGEKALFRIVPRTHGGGSVERQGTEWLEGLPGALLLEEAFLTGMEGGAGRGVLVPVGTCPPVWMPNLAAELPESSLLVLTGGSGKNLELRPFPRFVSLDRLVAPDQPAPGVDRVRAGDAESRFPLRTLRLTRGAGAAARSGSAALLDAEETRWLGHLLGRVPAGPLEFLRAAHTPRGLLVMAERGAMDLVPFGIALRRHRAGALVVPLGSVFEPDLPDEVLREKLKLTDGTWTVILPDVRVDVAETALRPLLDLLVEAEPLPRVEVRTAAGSGVRAEPRAAFAESAAPSEAEAPPAPPGLLRKVLSVFVDWGRREKR